MFITRWLAASTLFAVVSHGAFAGPFPEWNAGEVLKNAELVAVVDGPTPFRGSAISISRFQISELLLGEVEVGSEIVFYQPSGHMHGYAHIQPGDCLLMLRRMTTDEVDALRSRLPDWADDLPEQVWTFAWDRAKGWDGHEGSGGHQWMSWIQFTSPRFDNETRTIIEGEIDDRPRSILLGKLKIGADVEPEREDILTYIKDLIALRQSALAGVDVPDENELDVFQREVVQSAIAEREQQAQ